MAIMNLLPLLTLVVYGPTQFGKSSFIRRLGAQMDSSAIGAGKGRSVTSVPRTYMFNLTWPDDGAVQPLSIIDMPGLDDTELSISDELIGNSIRYLLAHKECQKIDGLLMFNALSESSTHVKKTFNEIWKALGNVTSSSIFILSKSDLAQSVTPGLKHTAVEDCESLGLGYVEWSDFADEGKMITQLIALRKELERLTPFTIEHWEQEEETVKNLALFLRESDPDRYVEQTITIEEPIIEEYMEDETFTAETAEIKYHSEEEIRAAALEKQKAGPKDYPVIEIETVKYELQKAFEVEESGFFLFFYYSNTDYVMRPQEEFKQNTKIVYRERPLDYYISLVKNEIEQRATSVTRQVKNYKKGSCEKTQSIKLEKYQFEYYLEKARKTMTEDFWKANIIIMIVLPLLILVVYGPTQYGKSTFIRRLGGNLEDDAIGKGTGRSVTSVPNIYNFNVSWSEDIQQPISIIDLPGLDDTELSLSNEFIVESIKLFMAQRKVSTINAILIFNSLAESSTRVKTSLKEISAALPNVTSSVVFILSKCDRANTSAKYLKATVIEDCEYLKVPYVEWTDFASIQGMNTQLSNLRKAINSVQTFNLSKIAELENMIEQRALYIREHDPDRYATQKTTVEVPKVDETEVDEDYSVMEAELKYKTEEELIKAAEELQKNGPKDFPKIETKMVVRQLRKTIVKPRSFNVLVLSASWTSTEEVTEDVEVPETQITYVERPLSQCIEQLKKEMTLVSKTKTRKVKEYSVTNCDEEREILYEKYPFEHYLEIARKEIVQELWKALRNAAKSQANLEVNKT